MFQVYCFKPKKREKKPRSIEWAELLIRLKWPNLKLLLVRIQTGVRQEYFSDEISDAASTASPYIDESVGIAVKFVIETGIRLYIHYIYSHTSNLNES